MPNRRKYEGGETAIEIMTEDEMTADDRPCVVFQRVAGFARIEQSGNARLLRPVEQRSSPLAMFCKSDQPIVSHLHSILCI